MLNSVINIKWDYLFLKQSFIFNIYKFSDFITTKRKKEQLPKNFLNWKRKITNKKYHISTGYMFHKNAKLWCEEIAYFSKNCLFFCYRNEAKIKKLIGVACKFQNHRWLLLYTLLSKISEKVYSLKVYWGFVMISI